MVTEAAGGKEESKKREAESGEDPLKRRATISAFRFPFSFFRFPHSALSPISAFRFYRFRFSCPALSISAFRFHFFRFSLSSSPLRISHWRPLAIGLALL
jgi:hypothetical protein